MTDVLAYIFWPNPPAPSYSNPKIAMLLLLCAVLVAASFAIRQWRKKQHNAVTRKLTRSYAVAFFWFGIAGLFLLVCRVEGISYLSMRFWWIVWSIAIVAYVLFQWKMFRMRHYTVIPQQERVEDPKDHYLPKRKKKKK